MIRAITVLTALALLTTMSFANAETPETVTVTGFPFEVSVLEGGSITFTNNNDTVMDFVSYGWFEGSVQPNESLTIDLPITDCGNVCFFAEDYYIRDLSTGDYSILHIIAKPIVVEAIAEPVVQTVALEESLQVEETVVTEDEGIYNVTLVSEEPDVITLQLQLAETTSSLNSALEQIGVKNAEISLLNEEINNLNSQLVIANSTVVDITYTEQLESQIVSLTAEKDKWKQLANSWYTVAMEQLRVMVQVLGL